MSDVRFCTKCGVAIREERGICYCDKQDSYIYKNRDRFCIYCFEPLKMVGGYMFDRYGWNRYIPAGTCDCHDGRYAKGCIRKIDYDNALKEEGFSIMGNTEHEKTPEEIEKEEQKRIELEKKKEQDIQMEKLAEERRQRRLAAEKRALENLEEYRRNYNRRVKELGAERAAAEEARKREEERERELEEIRRQEEEEERERELEEMLKQKEEEEEEEERRRKEDWHRLINDGMDQWLDDHM